MFKVIIYKCEGSINNPTILSHYTNVGQFNVESDAKAAFDYEMSFSKKHGADIKIIDGDAYWIDDSGRIEYCMKIEEV